MPPSTGWTTWPHCTRSTQEGRDTVSKMCNNAHIAVAAAAQGRGVCVCRWRPHVYALVAAGCACTCSAKQAAGSCNRKAGDGSGNSMCMHAHSEGNCHVVHCGSRGSALGGTSVYVSCSDKLPKPSTPPPGQLRWTQCMAKGQQHAARLQTLCACAHTRHLLVSCIISTAGCGRRTMDTTCSREFEA